MKKLKRTLALILSTILIFTSFPLVSMAKLDSSGDWRYDILSDNTVRITEYTGFGFVTEINIPKYIDGRVVTEVGDYGAVFNSATKLERVSIPDSVTSISYSAFSGCSLLKNVKIPEGVKSINGSAFYGCDSLTNIMIPDSVTTIGDEAFYGCSSLANISIGEGVESIGGGAFSDTALYNNNSKWDNGVLYIGDYLVDTNRYDVSSRYSIRENTRLIADNAFASDYLGYNRVTSITIPGSVKYIGANAFANCDLLANVTIGDGVTCIGASAFSGCTSLSDITIPKSVTSIGSNAFVDIALYTKPEEWTDGVFYRRLFN